jgi:hypothetical protein
MALLKAPAAASNRFFRRWRWLSIVLVLSELELRGQAAISPEYQLKAVFLFNFARFVDWPPKVFVAPDAPLVIGVLGEDPFGAYLDETVRRESVNGHPLIVQRYRRTNEVRVCHVLFISRSEGDRLEQIFTALRGRNVLTVGDTDDFIVRGGMIRLGTESKKIRMHVNTSAAKAADLTLSAKLLRVAQIEL